MSIGTIQTTAEQLLDGLPLNTTAVSRHCTACGRELGVADDVRVYCCRLTEAIATFPVTHEGLMAFADLEE